MLCAIFEVCDKLAGQYVSIRVVGAFIFLSVNGRNYRSRRVSGKFDGIRL